MPLLKFAEVVSYSSEDVNHPVNNLLKPDTYLKWKSEAGRNEKQEYVILKLEQLSSIQSVDIGNENSAFIEVLVSRDGSDFKVLLVASAFMSPLESRNNSAPNRVRMFGMDKLNKNVADQKWDRIKVVCTQPFNKNLQYGLTFVKAYGPEKKQSSGTETSLGKFTLIEDEEQDDSLAAGSFFAKRQESFSSESNGSSLKRSSENDSVPNPPSSGFYQLKKKIKESSLKDDKDLSLTKPFKEENKKRETKTEDKPITKPKERNPVPQDSKASKTEVPKAPKTPQPPNISRNSSSKVKIKRKSRSFNKLMNDVVFVLSGYQNPKRSQLRDSLIDMGAKYKGDWGKGCTHLICAFKNTPKYQSVKGRGKIVGEKWVQDSHQKKIRFPWRRYSLEKNDEDESEEEIWASEICSNSDNEDLSSNKKKRLSDTDDMAESEDTDDEIQRALNDNKDFSQETSKTKSTKDKADPAPLKDHSSGDEYDADTDVDEEEEKKKNTTDIPLPPLKNAFSGKTMYLFGSSLNEQKKKILQKYIIAFQGSVASYMSKNVNYVITDDDWDGNFDDALEENPSLQFVKSQWIWKCWNSEKMVPPQPFLVVPKGETN